MRALIVLFMAAATTACGMAASPSGAVPSGSIQEASPDVSAEATMSNSPTPRATASSDSTSLPPDLVEGIFTGDPRLGAPCIWITDNDGVYWELSELPEGYRVEFEGISPILYADGVVVARGGDRLVAKGTPNPPDIGSVCMVGHVFPAEEVYPAPRSN